MKSILKLSIGFTVVLFTGCGSGDSTTQVSFESACVSGDTEVSCADLGFGGDFNVQPEGEAGSNDFELHCEEQSSSVVNICGPVVQIQAAQNGDNRGLADFLSKYSPF